MTSLTRNVQRMYLIPMDKKSNTYIGAMITEEESVISDTIEIIFSRFMDSNNVVHCEGVVKEYDWLMKKIIPKNIKSLGIDETEINILPFYLGEDPHKQHLTMLAIMLSVIMLCVIFVIFKKEVDEKKKIRMK